MTMDCAYSITREGGGIARRWNLGGGLCLRAGRNTRLTLVEDATRPEKWVNYTHLENSPRTARYVYYRRCTEQGP